MPAGSLLAAAGLRAQRVVLRSALALPAPVQRVLAGRRVTADGQTLATDVQLMLRLQRWSREPDAASLPLAEGRVRLLRHTVITGGRYPVGALRDLPVGGLGGRLYVPEGAVSPGPLLVFFHGGAFVYGDLDSHDPVCRFLVEHSGVRVLAVDYRLAPEHPFPAACDDAVAAYRWVIANAASLGADPDRLAVGGDSAGGNLAAVTAIAAAREGLPLAFQLLIYPATEVGGSSESRRRFASGFYLTQQMMDLADASYLPDPATHDDPRAHPIAAVLPPGLAPAYVATAGFDPLRDEGEAYARRLADAGVGIELRRYADQIHGFVNMTGVSRSARAATGEVAAALGTALRRQ